LTPAGRIMRPALAALVVALALAGCGADDDSGAGGDGAAEVEGVGDVVAGSTAQLADCGDWRSGTEDERYATIEDIRGQLTPQGSETAKSDLSDEAAYEVFDHACEPEFSDKLRLYKLYARAQAFAPLTSDR
jgi:hypothetical protein